MASSRCTRTLGKGERRSLELAVDWLRVLFLLVLVFDICPLKIVFRLFLDAAN